MTGCPWTTETNEAYARYWIYATSTPLYRILLLLILPTTSAIPPSLSSNVSTQGFTPCVAANCNISSCFAREATRLDRMLYPSKNISNALHSISNRIAVYLSYYSRKRHGTTRSSQRYYVTAPCQHILLHEPRQHVSRTSESEVRERFTSPSQGICYQQPPTYGPASSISQVHREGRTPKRPTV